MMRLIPQSPNYASIIKGVQFDWLVACIVPRLCNRNQANSNKITS